MRKITALLLSVIICLLMFPASVTFGTQVTELYIANGATDGDGSFEKPFGTFKEAQAAIRAIKEKGGLPKGGINVYVRGGEYNLTEGISFGTEDSGETGSPITYSNYRNEKVVLVGGVEINGANFSKVTDESVLNRILTSSARPYIVQFDLKSMGVTDYGELNYPGAYPMPWLSSMAPAPELFFNDEPLTLSRYPNDGFMTVDRIIKPGAFIRGWHDDENASGYVPVKDRDPEDNFIISYKESRIDKWAGVEGIKLYGYWMYDWADTTVDVKKIDPEMKTIASVQPAYYQVKEGQRFYAYNLLEEIDVPGEYYIDRSNGILYLYPPEEIKSAKVHLSLLKDRIFTVDGAKNITINGFEITATRNTPFYLNKTEDISILNCLIKNTADASVYGRACYRTTVRGCSFVNVDGGVDIQGGDIPTLTHGDNVVDSCYFRNFSRITTMYNPAAIVRGCGNVISHNVMHDAPHTAVMFEGPEHTVEYNEIYDVLKESSDAAAIYTGFEVTARGNIVRYNYIHDIYDTVHDGGGYAHGVYLDNCHSSVNIFGNIFENFNSPAVMVNGGRNNSVRNNIFINCSKALWMTDAGLGIAAGEFATSESRFPKELAQPHITSDVWMAKYPEVAEMPYDEMTLPKYNVYANNVEAACNGNSLDTNAARLTTMKNNYVLNDADPGFVNMKSGNYNLKENAVVFEKIPGFVPIKFDSIGMYTDSSEEQFDNCVVMMTDSPNALAYGEKLQIDKDDPNVTARVQNGRTLVPIRFASETFGAIVKWNEAANEVSVKYRGNTVIFPIGENKYFKNGEEIITEQGAVIENDRALVPLRIVCETLSKQVYWNPAGIIAIYSEAEDIKALENEKIVDVLINNLR